MWKQNATMDEGEIAAALLQMERLADALAEGEFADMGLSTKQAELALDALISAPVMP
jgi:hypothetical protein